DGVMIRDGGEPGLLIGGRVRPWSFHGYGAAAPADPADRAEVLTPPSIVAAITAGYRPLVQPSALATIPPAGPFSAVAGGPRANPHMSGGAARFGAASALFQCRRAPSHDGSTEGSKTCGDAFRYALARSGRRHRCRHARCCAG